MLESHEVTAAAKLTRNRNTERAVCCGRSIDGDHRRCYTGRDCSPIDRQRQSRGSSPVIGVMRTNGMSEPIEKVTG